VDTGPASKFVIVIGQGYVGLPLAMAAVEAGFRVLGVDTDEKLLERLAAGKSHVEDVPAETIAAAISSGLYTAQSDLVGCAGFSHAIITVPTPLNNGQPDLSFIQAAARALAPHVSPGVTIVLESTTYPGTTEELVVPLLESETGLKAGLDFYVGYSPERIDPGNQEWNLTNTPKVVSGVNKISLERVAKFYEDLGIFTVPVSGTREAELTKLLENTFRHVNIALVNELAMFSATLGVDIWESIEAASTKPFGFMKFLPGPGVGGHCLPIDPSYLSWAIEQKAGRNFRFVELANSINSHMPQFVVERAIRMLGEHSPQIDDSKILIAGLAYKPNTSDTRESPALKVVELLQARGISVYGVDKNIPEYAWPKHVVRVVEGQEMSFDLGILLTNHSQDNGKNPLKGCARILDTRNVLTGTNVEHL